MLAVSEDMPYALRSEQEQLRRLNLLALPHIQPLTAYLEQIRSKRGTECKLPCFDPCDGGTNAKALFLLEAPGPKAVCSTFVSRNNPDQTARNLCELMQLASIPRAETVIWNVVPWYVGDGKRIRPVSSQDLIEAKPYLKDLLGLLSHLRVIVLCGKKAQRAEVHLQQLTALPIISTYHMSPCVFNRIPAKKELTQAAFRQVATLLQADG